MTCQRQREGGLDLSETADLTALVLISRDPLNGIWSVKPTFWLPAEGLAEKAQHYPSGPPSQLSALSAYRVV